MRGSFGGRYGLGRNSGCVGGGGGGGGGGGDGMMRTIGRVMRTGINGVQDPFPSSSNTNTTISSKRSSTPPKTRGNNNNNNNNNKLIISSLQNNNSGQFPVSAAWSSCPYVVESDDVVNGGGIDEGWECLEDFYDPVFGLVPTNHEVKNAIFSVQQFLHPEEILYDVDNNISRQITSATDVLQRASSTGSSEVDWIEPSMQLYNRRLANSYGWEKVYDAFHLLQTEPSVQKMVVSLSSDKAVWDAVLNNETVREIRDLYLKAAEPSQLNPDNNPDALKENSNVLKWIMDNVKGKLMEVVGNITKLIGGIFNPPNPDKAEESLDFSERLKSSFLLTILVLLIVVVSRGSKA